jgi:protein translocase SecG subunit
LKVRRTTGCSRTSENNKRTFARSGSFFNEQFYSHKFNNQLGTNMLLGLISHYFFGLTIFFTSLFLVLLVLVQRGRGGGIAGALGGAGGQSAFGTKAGDLFTRSTF